jgi:hypothetical protein
MDVSGTVIASALAADVRGLTARAWLTSETLDSIGRLGVATVRWRLPPPDQPAGAAHAASMVAAGRPQVVVVAEDEAPSVLVLTGAPAAPRAATLAAHLDALSPAWRERLAGRPPLTALFERLVYEAPAHLLQLRPRPEGSLDPATLVVERVWIDGRPAR